LITKIENKLLTVAINDIGAELISIVSKNDNTEYLWQKDEKVWGRQAPILFPIVGRLKDNEYKYEDKTYSLTQHGFARDMVFELKNEDKDGVEYTLTYDDSTLEKYPFKFELVVRYYLKDNDIVVEYDVKNLDNKKMYFSIGAHPGFNVPLCEGEKLEDYYIEFDQLENANKYSLNDDSNLIKQPEEFFNNDNIINLKTGLFNNNAFVFKDLKSEKMTLKSKKCDKTVSISYKGFPYIVIWGTPNNSPFICMEPFNGLPDIEDTDNDFKTKKGIIELEKESKFSCKHIITIK
jgi:galactose mutarotase-like enzyme